MSAAPKSATPTTSLTRREIVDPRTYSNLHDHRQHERSAARSLLEESSQLHTQLLLDHALIGPLFGIRRFDDLGDEPCTFHQQIVAAVDDESSRDDVRGALERAR